MSHRQMRLENVRGRHFDESNMSSKHSEALESGTMDVNQNKWREAIGYTPSQNTRRVSAPKEREIGLLSPWYTSCNKVTSGFMSNTLLITMQ